MRDIAAPHPALSGKVIGYSSQGRPIRAYEIGEGSQVILCIGGMHGNERGARVFVTKLANWLHHHPHAGVRFCCIPSLNPDGQALAVRHPDFWGGGRKGRLNARGVDLNRNFPTPSFAPEARWMHGHKYQDSTVVFAGEHAGSEAETKALMSYVTQVQPACILAFHTAGADVLGAGDDHSQHLARVFSLASGYRLLDPAYWDARNQTGTMKEWAEHQAVPYVEVEGKHRWGSDWSRQYAGVAAIIQQLSALS